MRIGYGYDSHRFEPEGGEKPLVLGGVVVPGCAGLKAHSDGDVVIHAIIDALLGAAALGDIGSHFPDTAERYRKADSAALLTAVVSEIKAAGYTLGNLDVTIICERPKIAPIREAIRERLARLLALPVTAISVKGKTNEGLDSVGSGLAILCHAVCLIV